MSEAEFDQRLAPVWSALDAQPFGDPQQLASTSREVAEWLESQALHLKQNPIKQGDGKTVLRNIASTGKSQFYDYDSARQLIWAFERVHHEIDLHENPPTTEDESKVGVPSPWAGWLAGVEEPNAIQNVLMDLDTEGEGDGYLILDLRKGRSTTQKFKGESAARPQVEVEPAKTLKPVAAYDPQFVQDAFRRLHEALAE